jgi:hypothetical protein
MAKKRSKKGQPQGNMQVTGRTIAYQQSIGTNGKLGKPKAVMITTARVVGAPAPQEAPAPMVKRRKRRSSTPSYY